MGRCGMIIAGYPGVGKSTYYNKYIDNVIDSDSSIYKDNYSEDDWVKEYVSAAIYHATFGETVFVSTHKEVLEELNKQAGESGIFCGLVYPSMALESWWVKKLQCRMDLDPTDKNRKAYYRAYSYYESDIRDMNMARYENITKLIISKKEYIFEDAVNTFREMADKHYETEEVKYKMDMSQIEEQLVRIITKLDNMEKANEARDEKIDTVICRLNKLDSIKEENLPVRTAYYIGEILDDLYDVWADSPELRLGQLIGNVLKDPELYYLEDDKLIEKLQSYYNALKLD